MTFTDPAMNHDSTHGLGTRAIHAGQSPDPTTGAVMTPIYATSTYAQSAPAILLQQPSKCGMAMREFPRRIEDGRILCEQFKTSMRMGMTRQCITPICNLIPY